MARPRTYDPELVLKNAMTVFWKQGFTAASMSDIYAATGLKPGNLYATFTDKHTLFRRAFETYAQQFRATLPLDVFGLDAIRAWIEVQARLAIDDPERKGCLIVNTTIEREAHDPETRAMAAARMDEITAFFRDNLAIARDRGEVPSDLEVEAACRGPDRGRGGDHVAGTRWGVRGNDPCSCRSRHRVAVDS